MCESYSRSLLRVSVAQICQALGWDSVQLTACDLLTDVLHRYIQQLARGCHRYSELYDVGPAFKLMGVNLSELEDYVHNLEPVGFAHQIPLFPVSKNNILQFPQPGTQDAEERKEYIPDYMPPIVSSQEDDVGPAFKLMGVNLSELEDYVHNLEPVGFAHQIPLFPVSKNNILQFPQPGTQDAEERKEYIPDYMPPIVSSQEGGVIVSFSFYYSFDTICVCLYVGCYLIIESTYPNTFIILLPFCSTLYISILNDALII
ncbi:UNVERIFIED_CONTAM: hypothetical protein FKN15_045500 [Acipenser sinensis]